MNLLLCILQVLAALMYGSSGTMKVFMFDKPPHGIHRLWPDGSSVDQLTSGRPQTL